MHWEIKSNVGMGAKGGERCVSDGYVYTETPTSLALRTFRAGLGAEQRDATARGCREKSLCADEVEVDE